MTILPDAPGFLDEPKVALGSLQNRIDGVTSRTCDR